MRFSVHSLSLQGFRSFRKPSTFCFDEARGLVLVTGKNLVEPRLGANGVGKSTLFEGLYWALFGKTSVNLRASDVATWDGAVGVRASVAFSLDDERHEIVRLWNPNSLTYDGKVVEQRELEQLLGWTPATFLYAVYHAQFVTHFADLEPASQLEVYSELLRLNVWDAAIDTASARAKRSREELIEAERSLAGVSAQLLVLSERFDEESLAEARWWRKVLRDTQSALAEAQAATARTDDAVKVLATHSRTAIDRTPLKAAREVSATATKETTQAQAEVRRLNSALGELERRRDGLDGERDCPTCGQELRRRNVSEHFVKEIKAVTEALGVAERAVALRAKAAERAEERLNVLAEDVQAKEKEHSRKLGALEEAVTSARKHSRSAAAHVDEMFAEECPYDSARVAGELQEARAKSARLSKQVAHLRWLGKTLEFWSGGFREIKLDLVSRSIAQFEATTNAVLPVLGLANWLIAYDVESETKTGKLRRGFTIYVLSPHNTAAVPFKAWSGGERQRLRLAVALGLSDLVQDCLGLYSNLEIFDEPTAWLAELGIDDLLECLAARAREHAGVLMLADHRSLQSGQAERIVTVEKGLNGSYLAEA